MSGKNRIDGQSAYILHSQPWRETSLILDVFSREHGKLAMVARGARRPHSQLRGLLMAFQPLELSWFGAGEMRTLAKADWLGGQPFLTGQSLLIGYYLNELLLRLLPRDDAHPALFDAYAQAIRRLASEGQETADLRRFEIVLLRELGYAVQLEYDADSEQPLREDGLYAYLPERGPVRVNHPEAGAPLFFGRVLLAMARDDYSHPETLFYARALMRYLLTHTLGGQVLNSRRVFMEMQEF